MSTAGCHPETFVEHALQAPSLAQSSPCHFHSIAVDFIHAKAEQAKNGKPFFLYMAFGSPHTPILPTAEWIGKSGIGKYGDFVMMTDGMAGRIIDPIDLWKKRGEKTDAKPGDN